MQVAVVAVVVMSRWLYESQANSSLLLLLLLFLLLYFLTSFFSSGSCIGSPSRYKL